MGTVTQAAFHMKFFSKNRLSERVPCSRLMVIKEINFEGTPCCSKRIPTDDDTKGSIAHQKCVAPELHDLARHHQQHRNIQSQKVSNLVRVNEDIPLSSSFWNVLKCTQLLNANLKTKRGFVLYFGCMTLHSFCVVKKSCKL